MQIIKPVLKANLKEVSARLLRRQKRLNKKLALHGIRYQDTFACKRLELVIAVDELKVEILKAMLNED